VTTNDLSYSTALQGRGPPRTQPGRNGGQRSVSRDPQWQNDMNLIHSKFGRRTKHTRRLFLEMNLDRVGNVDLDELTKGLNFHGIMLSRERVRELSRIDEARTPGVLAYDEFLRFIRDCSGQSDYSDLMPHGASLQRHRMRGAVGASPMRPATQLPRNASTDELVRRLAAGFAAKGQTMREMFRALDSNDDGFVTQADFVAGCERLLKLIIDRRHAEGLFRRFDTTMDGSLSYANFVKIVQSGRA
jgi:Ca2+-binding EF-hand superfamily protein